MTLGTGHLVRMSSTRGLCRHQPEEPPLGPPLVAGQEWSVSPGMARSCRDNRRPQVRSSSPLELMLPRGLEFSSPACGRPRGFAPMVLVARVRRSRTLLHLEPNDSRSPQPARTDPWRDVAETYATNGHNGDGACQLSLLQVWKHQWSRRWQGHD
jgi:hypothetical protein